MLCTTLYLLKMKSKAAAPNLTCTQTELSRARHQGVPWVCSYHLLFVFLVHFKRANPTNLAARYCLRVPVCSQCRLATLLLKYHATHAAWCLSPSSLVGMQHETGRAMKQQKNKRFKKTGKETALKEKQQFLHFQFLLTLLPLHVQVGEEKGIRRACDLSFLPVYLRKNWRQSYFEKWNFNGFTANLK